MFTELLTCNPNKYLSMKSVSILFLAASLTITLFSCSESEEPKTPDPTEINEKEVIVEDFQAILDSAGLRGAILISDGQTLYSNDYDWAAKGHLPASTYKIPNSIIALELGVMENDSTISEWDGEPRFMKRWEQDLYLRDAFHLSCVPCYQDVARKIGASRMQEYVDRLNYGSMQFDSSNIDLFWLEGASRISQMQQIEFLQAFNEGKLSVSERTLEIMSRMMIIEENDRFTLRGKTGWSVTNDIDNCWFVGWVETDKGTYYFATNVEPGINTNSDDLFTTRKTITYKALELIAL
ncbi:MAG: hypothetical protein Crog4KO_21070 [Crocinitomicaceae bacterium]